MTAPTDRPAAPLRQPNPHRSIRNYLLDPGLQLRLGGYLAAVAGALSGVLGWQIWRAYREVSMLVALGDPRTDEVVAAMLNAEDRARLLWMVGSLAGVLLCSLLVAVVVTHRIAGPAMVLARVCRAVAEGDLTPPRSLRRGDLLVALADGMSGMINALRAREEQERAQLVEALEGLPRSQARDLLERLAAEKASRLQKR